VPEEVKVTGTVVENRENKEPPTASPMAGLQVTGCARELLPGFVLLPKVLSLELQQKLLDTACRVAAAPSGRSGGWYRCMPEPQLNDGNKARFWDQIDKFPPDFRCLGEQLALAAGRASPLLQQAANDFEPRVGALNFYTGKGRMNWHKDDYNFAKKDRPIVMASLGDTAEFGTKCRSQIRNLQYTWNQAMSSSLVAQQETWFMPCSESSQILGQQLCSGMMLFVAMAMDIV